MRRLWCSSKGVRLCWQVANARARHNSSAATSDATSTVHFLQQQYDAAFLRLRQLPPTPKVDRTAVFANNELDLSHIQAYGFDYDYTLAIYKFGLNQLIYSLALERLIRHFHYPYALRAEPYDLQFAIRGLHFDTKECLLMKLNQFCVVQEGTCYRGKRPLSGKRLNQIYPRGCIPEKMLNDKQRFLQVADLFSLPEIGLLCAVIDHFDRLDIEFNPLAVWQDVKQSVSSVHLSGQMYSAVMADLPAYVHPNPGLRQLLLALKQADKRTFVITNSPYTFFARGMEYLLGDDWRALLDIVVVQAGKPKFFQQNDSKFREYNVETDRLKFSTVTRFEPGKVYCGGNVREFAKLSTVCQEGGVLYFGDHIAADLSDLMLRVGWRTGCIVPELSREIALHNSEDYQACLQRLLTLKRLIHEHQDRARRDGPEALQLLNQWIHENQRLCDEVKCLSNPQFGSMFRTFHCATYFSHRLNRLADIYTARLPNLLGYSHDFLFYPSRNPLAHEANVPVPDVHTTPYTIRP